MTYVQEASTQASNLEEQNKAIVQRFYEEVFNQGREDVIDEIVAPDYLDYGHNPPGRGPHGARDDFRGGRSVFSNIHFTIDDLLAQGEQVIARWTGTLTHTGEFLGIAPTNKTVTITGISMYRLADGKLTETRNAVNWLPVLQQLGAMPE